MDAKRETGKKWYSNVIFISNQTEDCRGQFQFHRLFSEIQNLRPKADMKDMFDDV